MTLVGRHFVLGGLLCLERVVDEIAIEDGLGAGGGRGDQGGDESGARRRVNFEERRDRKPMTGQADLRSSTANPMRYQRRIPFYSLDVTSFHSQPFSQNSQKYHFHQQSQTTRNGNTSHEATKRETCRA